MSRELLKIIRIKEEPKLTAKQMIIQLAIYFLLGAFLGVIAKYSDTVSSNSGIGMIFDFISNTTTRLGIWVGLATFVAVWSENPKVAAFKVFGFFAGLLIAYYIYSQVLFGFFPTYYFLRWGAIALVSPLAAYIVWFSRREGGLSAICAALPIGLLLEQGAPFFYGYSVVLGFDLFIAILLLVILPKSKIQYLLVVPLSILLAFILRSSNILLYLFGGL
ncbi:hypothetical protein [Metabacillus niabensis]|uniref:hypothetical protein n=1 Tax=Metabacillus niabensis TaxID=324854 RepID=UPI0039A1F379